MTTVEPATCLTLHFSRHALERMFQRGIPPDAVNAVLSQGEIIASYPADRPYPSVLILGWYDNKPVHAVIAQNHETQECQVITVYQPDPLLWHADFKIEETVMKCSLCKTGETHPGKTTVTLQRGETVVVIRDVPAEICEDCGEYFLDEVTARRVYSVSEQACARHVDVEIQRYAA